MSPPGETLPPESRTMAYTVRCLVAEDRFGFVHRAKRYVAHACMVKKKGDD